VRLLGRSRTPRRRALSFRSDSGFAARCAPWSSGDRLHRQGFLTPAFYETYVRPHLYGVRDYTLKIWGAMMFQFWHRRFIEDADLDLGIRTQSEIAYA
jgi:hypothetical protein